MARTKKEYKKYKPSKLELIEREMRTKGKHYADYQKEELEKKRTWFKGVAELKKKELNNKYGVVNNG